MWEKFPLDLILAWGLWGGEEAADRITTAPGTEEELQPEGAADQSVCQGVVGQGQPR